MRISILGLLHVYKMNLDLYKTAKRCLETNKNQSETDFEYRFIFLDWKVIVSFLISLITMFFDQTEAKPSLSTRGP